MKIVHALVMVQAALMSAHLGYYATALLLSPEHPFRMSASAISKSLLKNLGIVLVLIFMLLASPRQFALPWYVFPVGIAVGSFVLGFGTQATRLRLLDRHSRHTQ